MATALVILSIIWLGVSLTCAVSLPGAVTARRRVATTTTAADTLDKAVTEAGDGGLELVVVAGVPLGTLSRDGILAGESNEQDVVVVVAAVAIDTLAVASSGQRDGGFANHGLFVVVAVLVTPNTVDLGTCQL